MIVTSSTVNMTTQLMIQFLTLFFGVIAGSAIGPFLTGQWSLFWEEEKLQCALRMKVKQLLFRGSCSGPQSIENVADEWDQLAQSTVAGVRRKSRGYRRVSNTDLLKAVDVLRRAAKEGTGVKDRTKQRELIELLRIRLSPDEEEQLQISGRTDLSAPK
jgi:hypothetical protein